MSAIKRPLRQRGERFHLWKHCRAADKIYVSMVRSADTGPDGAPCWLIQALCSSISRSNEWMKRWKAHSAIFQPFMCCSICSFTLSVHCLSSWKQSSNKPEARLEYQRFYLRDGKMHQSVYVPPSHSSCVSLHMPESLWSSIKSHPTTSAPHSSRSSSASSVLRLFWFTVWPSLLSDPPSSAVTHGCSFYRK